VGWVSLGSVVGRSLGQMSVCRREGGEWRACAGTVDSLTLLPGALTLLP